MQIICPHCQHTFESDAQPQYIDANSQQKLVVCPQCAGEIQLGKSSGIPAPLAVLGEQPFIDWEQNWRADIFRAYVRTVKGVITHPVNYTGSLPPSRDLLALCLFAYITAFLTAIPIMFYQILFSSFMRRGYENAVSQAFTAAFGILIGPFLAVGFGFLLAGIFHLSYTYIGGSRKSYLTTLTVIFYGYAVNWLNIIPILGSLAQMVYGFILGIGAQARAHQIEPSRAALAYLLPIVVCCCCVGLFYLLFAGAIIGIINQLR